MRAASFVGLFVLSVLFQKTIQQGLRSERIQTKLKLVQIIFRHGDRTPTAPLPNDVNNASVWDKYGGYGQLTQKGMQQERQFGFFIRQYYAEFLSKFYSTKEVYARSTDYDRTLMSIYSLLSGLYEPVDYQKFDVSLNWQPVPVHTTEHAADKVLHYAPCPKYDRLKEESLKSSEYIEFSTRFKDIFDLIEKETGSTNYIQIADTIFVEHENSLPLPLWAQNSYNKIIEMFNLIRNFDYLTIESAKLVAGGVLNDMVTNINNKVNGSTYQLYLYSAHDTFVAPLIKLLNLTSYITQPPYGGAVVLELHQSLDNDRQYYIRVLIKNNTSTETMQFIPMRISGNEQMLPLEAFLKYAEDKTVVDFNEACDVDHSGSSKLKFRTFLLIAFFAGLVALLVIFGALHMCFKSNHTSSRGFHLLNSRNNKSFSLYEIDENTDDDL